MVDKLQPTVCFYMTFQLKIYKRFLKPKQRMCDGDHMRTGKPTIYLTLYRTSLPHPALNVSTIANTHFKIQPNRCAK